MLDLCESHNNISTQEDFIYILINDYEDQMDTTKGFRN